MFQPKAEDTKPIAEAIQSGNHMKIYAGFVAFKKLFETKIKEQTTQCNPKNIENRRFLLEEMLHGKSKFIKEALLRDREPDEVEYHELGFTLLLDLIQLIFQYPLMFKPEIPNELISDLNDLLRQVAEDENKIKLYEKFCLLMVQKIDYDQKNGPELIFKLNLWQSISDKAFEKIKMNPTLAFAYSFIIFNSAFRVKQDAENESMKLLIDALLLCFNRMSEDISLIPKPEP